MLAAHVVFERGVSAARQQDLVVVSVVRGLARLLGRGRRIVERGAAVQVDQLKDSKYRV